MPVAVSYPGVYIEEIPSGVRTITGVATSITGFIGRAISGPVNKPVMVNSFVDFQRQFGGLGIDYPMSYAVSDFFRNGGGQAVVVRLFKQSELDGATGALDAGGLRLKAIDPGTWSSGLSAKVERFDEDDKSAARNAERFGLKAEDIFNLNVMLTVDGRIVRQERFINLTVKDLPTAAGRAQRVDRVLQQSSQLVQVPSVPSEAPIAGDFSPPPATAPPATPATPLGLVDDTDYIGDEAQKTGLRAFDSVDLFNLLCIPPPERGKNTSAKVYSEAMKYCKDRRAFLIVDPPTGWNSVADATDPAKGLGSLNFSGDVTRNAAMYFPSVKALDPLTNQLDTFAPCGLVAGAMAATDAQRGVWKAPAGLDAGLSGINGLSVKLTDKETGTLNQLGINCLRDFPVYGNVVWGARTLRGADQMADEYKYIPVRRLALFIEETLSRGTQWVVFEPNDEPLWAQIRLNIGAFMHNLFVKGAFQGQTPAAAYFVKCDKDTTTQNDIDLGIVNIHVGFAPLKPAEFVVIQIQQIAGNIQT